MIRKAFLMYVYATLIIAAFVLAASCTLNIMPPGAFPSVASPSVRVPTEGNALTDTNTQPETKTPVSSIYFVVHGNWRCHIRADIDSDTDIFLHDGELVQFVEFADNDLILILAGTRNCFVKNDALQEE